MINMMAQSSFGPSVTQKEAFSSITEYVKYIQKSSRANKICRTSEQAKLYQTLEFHYHI